MASLLTQNNLEDLKFVVLELNIRADNVDYVSKISNYTLTQPSRCTEQTAHVALWYCFVHKCLILKNKTTNITCILVQDIFVEA